MWIAVLTGMGEMYLFHVVNEKELEMEGARDIESWVAREIHLSPEEFHWQVLAFKGKYLNVKITEVM